jgi:hypothetical protein
MCPRNWIKRRLPQDVSLHATDPGDPRRMKSTGESIERERLKARREAVAAAKVRLESAVGALADKGGSVIVSADDLRALVEETVHEVFAGLRRREQRASTESDGSHDFKPN